MQSKVLSAIAMVCFFVVPALADPILVGFPAPGGTTVNASGNTGTSGGRTLNYSQNDPSQFSQLWFGLDQIGATYNGSLQALTYSLALSSSTQAIWTGQTTIASLQYNGSVSVEFIATLTGGAPGGWINASSVGINGGPPVVADVTAGPFSVNEQFLVNVPQLTGASFVPFLDFFNGLNTTATSCPQESGTLPTCLAGRSVTGEFYYNPAVTAVPGPVVGAGLPGLIAACAGLVALARRRKTRA